MWHLTWSLSKNELIEIKLPLKQFHEAMLSGTDT